MNAEATLPKKQTSADKIALVLIGAFACVLYLIIESMGRQGMGATAWMNAMMIAGVSVFGQVLVNRANKAQAALVMANIRLEEKVRERTAEVEEANRLLNEEIAIRTLTEEFLRESEEKYRAIFDAARTPTVIANEDKTINLANRKFQELSGYTIEEVAGSRDLADFFTKESVSPIYEYFRASFTDGSYALSETECELIDKSGRHKKVLMTITPIPTTDQHLVTLVDAEEQTVPADADQASIATTAPLQDEKGEAARLAEELRAAVKNDEFTVAYQPIIRSSTKRIVGFEALARWKHPRRGLLEAEEFIDQARAEGILSDIDRFIIELACRQISNWQGLAKTTSPLFVCVNLSRNFLLNDDVKQSIMNNLVEQGLSSQSLVIDVTAEDVAEDRKEIGEVLESLGKLGVRSMMDNVKNVEVVRRTVENLAAGFVKVDRSLISALDSVQGGEYKTLSAIKKACDQAGKSVLPVGVEDVSQHLMLSNLDCPFAQGALYCRPMDRQMLDRVLKKRQKSVEQK